MAIYRFVGQSVCELNTRERSLLVDGQPAALGARALDVLVALVGRAGQVVGRQELLDLVWPQAAIEDNNLNVQVGVIRKLLGAAIILTVPGRGYTFIPQTTVDSEEGLSQPLPSVPRPAHLPAQPLPLVGRDGDIVLLEQLLTESRLVTVLGAGGMGKTALARHLLHRLERRFRHGVCFVDLSMLQDGEELPGAMSAALGMHSVSVEPLAGLAGALAPTEILVVLDGAEHLIDAVAQAAKILHDTAPGLRLLVTSQAPLKLAVESLHRLGPLAVPEADLPAHAALAYGAVALFDLRAKAVDSRFALTDDTAPLAIQLCRALDGLPLALELAASRAPILGLAQLVLSLQEPLHLLVSPNRYVLPRHQTLRNALAWSHDLLSVREQTVLRRMAVLAGSSDLALIQHVVCDPAGQGPIDAWAAVEAVSALVDRSLVAAVPGWGGHVRYRLLDTPRSFAHERLCAAGECATIGRRHALAVLAQCERAHAERYSHDVCVEDWQARQLLELDNGRAALAWAQRHGEQQVALALMPGLLCSTATEERAKLLALTELAADLAQDQQDRPAAMWSMVEAAHIIAGVDPKLSRRVADLAVVSARQCTAQPDARGLYRALCVQALAMLIDARIDDGARALAEARQVEQADWPAAVLSCRWRAEVWLADRQGDGPGVYACSLRLVSLQRKAGYPAWGLGLTLVNGALAAGRAQEAVRQGLRVIAEFEGTRHIARLTETRIQLVGALIDCGRLDEARAHSAAAWPYASRFGRQDVWADYHALLLVLEGSPQDAARLLGFANERVAKFHATRTRNEAVAVARTLERLEAALDPSELQALLAQGGSLQESDIADMALSGMPAELGAPEDATPQ